MNIGIMRAFVQLRGLLASHEDLARTLAALEKKYDAQFRVVFDAIRELMRPREKPQRSIGFRAEETRAAYRVRRQPASPPRRGGPGRPRE